MPIVGDDFLRPLVGSRTIESKQAATSIVDFVGNVGHGLFAQVGNNDGASVINGWTRYFGSSAETTSVNILKVRPANIGLPSFIIARRNPA